MQIQVYGFYLAEPHLKEDTTKSQAFFKQLRQHVDKFAYDPPTEPPKRVKGKKKTVVHLSHYRMNDEKEDCSSISKQRFEVSENATLQNAQRKLNLQIGLDEQSCLAPMAFFVGKLEGGKFEFRVRWR